MTSAPPPEDPSAPPTPAPAPETAPPSPYAAPPQYTAAPQYGAPLPYAPAAPRPGMVTAAGIVMIVLGALVTLFGVLFLIGAAVIGGGGPEIETQIPGMPAGMGGAVAGVIVVFAVIFLAIGILDIVAGANVLGGRGWARITGIVLAVILGLFSLLGLGNNESGGIIVTLILLAANAFILWALISTGSWFAARAAR